MRGPTNNAADRGSERSVRLLIKIKTMLVFNRRQIPSMRNITKKA